MATSVVSVNDGNSITVDDLIGMPMMIPARVIELLDNSFLDDTVFRDAGPNIGGVVAGEESTPLFLGSDVETVAEFAEIPVAAGQRGLARIWVGSKKGLGIRISKETRDEGKIGNVNLQIRQLANTTIRARERALRAALSNPAIPTIAAVGAWGTAGSRIRRDFANAIEKVSSARPVGATSEDVLGFKPNTAILPATMEAVCLDDDEFLKVYRGNAASESIAFTGKMPNDVLGLAPLLARYWPNDRAFIFERETVGFRSDARPLQSTELYPEGNGPNGGPTESWRSDTTYKRVIGVDQPLAGCWVTGIANP